jgi:UDP-N-acetylmuramate dehydrogenase
MTIIHNISLKPFNTFGIDAKAKSFCNISSVEGLRDVLRDQHSNPLFILGGGSNILMPWFSTLT